LHRFVKIVTISLNHGIPLIDVDEIVTSLQPIKAIRLGIHLPLDSREHFAANEP